MKQFTLLTMLLLLLIPTASPAAGQDDEQPPLLEMMTLVPNPLPDSRGWAPVQYVDYQALYTSEGIEDQRGDVETLLETVPLPGILSRINPAPEALQYALSGVEKMPEVVGFSWISDVNRSLDYGAPPQMALILQGSFDPEKIGAALQARGFEQTDVNGVPVWNRFEDSATNIDAIETADPFGGRLGMAARIAILPGYLANSRFWDMTNAVIDTAQGTQPSLIEDASYRAAAEAITAPEGLLLQALFFNPADIGVVPQGMPGSDVSGQDYGPLMPYTLAVLADRQEGQDQVHLIALVYPDADLAEAAAEEVAARIRTFSLPRQPDTVLVDRFGAEVSTSVYESTGKAVAVIEVRYPFPKENIDPETGQFAPRGLLYRAWINALIQRAFTPLLISEGP